jgi:hypothetical protein
MAHAAGLDYRWEIPGKRPLNILQSTGNGCAFLDYDGDGNLDILLVGTEPVLYKGDGKGGFVRSAALPPLHGHFLGCAVGDVNNDGYPDIYLSGFGEGRLLLNRGGKTFTDVSAAWGIRKEYWGTSAAFGDLDNDGWLDLYVAAYVRFRPDSVLDLCPIRGENGKTVQGSCPPTIYPPLQGRLYRNEFGRQYADMTAAWGANAATGNGLGVAFADFAATGWQGFAVANDMLDSDLFRNTGKGRLENIGTSAGITRTGAGKVYAGMGLDWGDFDNDGRLDLLMTAFGNQPKPLFHNEGAGVFTDVSGPAGLASALPLDMPFGCKFADFDNDGNLDVVYANGHVEDQIAVVDPAQTYRQHIRLFRGDGQGHFADIGAASGIASLPPIVGRGLAVGDFDNDGRLDLLIVDSEGTPLLLHNESRSANHWLGLNLAGTKSNRDGYGAMITVESGGKRWLRHCHSDGSYLSASDKRVHFGLGTATHVDRLTVRWPSGWIETFPVPGVDRYLTLTEGTGNRQPVYVPTLSP